MDHKRVKTIQKENRRVFPISAHGFTLGIWVVMVTTLQDFCQGVEHQPPQFASRAGLWLLFQRSKKLLPSKCSFLYILNGNHAYNSSKNLVCWLKKYIIKIKNQKGAELMNTFKINQAKYNTVMSGQKRKFWWEEICVDLIVEGWLIIPSYPPDKTAI